MWRSPGLAFVAAWMSLALALVVPAAQRPETPQFRAGVEVVAVDVSVVDRDGRPVPDLKPADFTLTVDGKPRRLASAEFVSLATRGSAGRAAPASRPGVGEASDGFSTNERVQPGRLIVLAIDQGHLQPTSVPGAVAAATRFLAGLGPADQVALVAFPQGGPSVPFTTRHDRIQEALKRVAGKAVSARSTSRLSISEALSYSRSGESPMPGDPWAAVLQRECAGTTRTGATALDKACVEALQGEALSVAAFEQQVTANTLGVLTDIVERLGDIEGPKTLVLLSEGLVVGGERVGQDSQVGTASQVGQAAYKARVNIYVLQLDRAFLDSFSVEYRTPPLSAGAEGQVMAAGLETLAGAARGAMFKITASADRAFNRVTLETSAFYLLAFEPEPADRDGKPHNIRVRVQRPNVSVRSRAEFVVGGAPRSVRSAEEEVTSLLQSPVLASGLPLRVGTFTLRDAATLKPRVLVAVDIARGVTAPAAVAVGYAVVDGTGAPVGSYVKTESLKPFGIGDEACWKHAQAMLLNPGDYTLKFAAVDPQGRRGSVEHRMTVGIQRAGSAQVSDLLLLDPSGEGPGGSNPAISGTITTDAVTMYLEVYSAQAGRPGKATATFEVAGTAAGAAMFTRQS
ncbi:MAG: VWA domain-containing protein, partial [Planctomycetes bacterium]|nr:VWA domain-containing protein [Planctomycetota bacterium]